MNLPPLSDFHIKCVELMNAAPETHATHCFRSALRHLEKAAVLADIDKEMSAFRVITAEEEAASGLMRALREMNYPGTEAMNVQNHQHKHAVFPFLRIVFLFFSQSLASPFKNFCLHIQEIDGARRLTVGLPLTIGGVDNMIWPHPPLDIFVSMAGTGSAPEFEEQMDEYMQAQGGVTIRAFLKEEANTRNTLLYASPNGYPRLEALAENAFVERQNRVMAMINVFLLIYPYPKHQAFVSHAISVFNKLIDQLGRKKTQK